MGSFKAQEERPFMTDSVMRCYDCMSVCSMLFLLSLWRVFRVSFLSREREEFKGYERVWKGIIYNVYIYIYSDLKCSRPGFGNAQGTPTSHWMLGTLIETTSARTFKWAPQRGLGRWAFRMDQIDRLSIPTGWTLESVSELLQATGSETHTVMHLYGTWLQVDIMLWTQCSILSPLPPHYWYYWLLQAWVWMRGRCILRLASTRLGMVYIHHLSFFWQSHPMARCASIQIMWKSRNSGRQQLRRGKGFAGRPGGGADFILWPLAIEIRGESDYSSIGVFLCNLLMWLNVLCILLCKIHVFLHFLHLSFWLERIQSKSLGWQRS